MSQNKKTNKILNFTEELLLWIGEFYANVLAPPISMSKIFEMPGEKEFLKKMYTKNKYYDTINRLEKYNYVQKEKIGKKTKIKLTNKGLIKLQRIKWKINKKEKDKNSYLVVFDIPEDKRRMRNLFRSCLYEMGFSKLQRSVFVSEYNIKSEIKSLVKNCELEKYVKIFVAKELKVIK